MINSLKNIEIVKFGNWWKISFLETSTRKPANLLIIEGIGKFRSLKLWIRFRIVAFLFPKSEFTLRYSSTRTKISILKSKLSNIRLARTSRRNGAYPDYSIFSNEILELVNNYRIMHTNRLRKNQDIYLVAKMQSLFKDLERK